MEMPAMTLLTLSFVPQEGRENVFRFWTGRRALKVSLLKSGKALAGANGDGRDRSRCGGDPALNVGQGRREL